MLVENSEWFSYTNYLYFSKKNKLFPLEPKSWQKGRLLIIYVNQYEKNILLIKENSN